MFGIFRRQPKPSELDKLKSVIPAEHHPALIAAFDGNAMAAQAIAIAAPSSDIGAVVIGAFKGSMPAAAFRTLLHDAWSMNHGALMDAVGGDRDTVRKMFAAARFDCSYLPERFPVYRGVKSRFLLQSRPGISWTTNRDAACWFATTFSIDPVVIKAEANRSDALYYSNDRSEFEVILSADKPYAIDGEESDWRMATTRHMDSLSRHNQELRASDGNPR